MFLPYSTKVPKVVFEHLPTGDDIFITVAATSKWYKLYKLFSNGKVGEVDFPEDCPANESPFVDHVPNPNAVIQFCNANGYYLDPLALELLVGRWTLEVKPFVQTVELAYD